MSFYTNPFNATTGTYYMPLEFTAVEPPKAKELYFLYGTLQRGHRNHCLLDLKAAKLISYDAFVNNYGLIELARGVPALVSSMETRDWTWYGELWELGEPNISFLDRFESGYVKTEVNVRISRGGHKAFAFIYTGKFRKEELWSGTWNIATELKSMNEGLHSNTKEHI